MVLYEIPTLYRELLAASAAKTGPSPGLMRLLDKDPTEEDLCFFSADEFQQGLGCR